MRMAEIRDRILALLYPPGACCIACGALRVDDPARALCKACLEKLVPLQPPFCPSCGQTGWAVLCPDCAAKKPDALDARAAAYPYADTGRALVRALKYGRVEAAAQALASGMLPLFPKEPIDGLVPVPLHKRRQRRRGFNQARSLCEALSRETGVPVLDALTRQKSTKTQTRLTREGRKENVQGAFQVRLPVDGLSLLLIDDVMTTGATAVSCAKALKEAGAARVKLLAAARAKLYRDA